jgi:hypothetical protein
MRKLRLIPTLEDVTSRAVRFLREFSAIGDPWSKAGDRRLARAGDSGPAIDDLRIAALQRWLERWSGEARSVLVRRVDLVRMGLEVQYSWKRITQRVRRCGRASEAFRATPHRAARFLDALAEEPTLRAALVARGMTEVDIREGSELLSACLRAPSPHVDPRSDSAIGRDTFGR